MTEQPHRSYYPALTVQQMQALTRDLIDDGKLIEAGWVGLRLACEMPSAPVQQLKAMRMAFFAGAQHVFASIMQSLDPDAEPTEADMRRMGSIYAELGVFIAEFAREHDVASKAKTD